MTEGILIAAGLLIATFLALDIGRWMRRRFVSASDDDAVSTGAVDGVVFALLGLLLAFTFNASATKFDTRRKLIVDQANALGTAWLRTDLLLPADREPVRRLMRQWVQAELDAVSHFERDPAAYAAQYDQAARLQTSTWQAAVAAVDRSPHPQYAGLVLAPINDWIDLTALRAEMSNRGMPPMMLAVLVLLTLVASLLAGFSMGKHPRRSLPHMLIFSTAIALTLYVIIDLNHPRTGLIRVDTADHAMRALYQSMSPDAAP